MTVTPLSLPGSLPAYGKALSDSPPPFASPRPTTPLAPFGPAGQTGPWQMLFPQLPGNPMGSPMEARMTVGYIGSLLANYVRTNPAQHQGLSTPGALQLGFNIDTILPNAPQLLDPVHTGLPASGLPGLTREHEFIAGVLRRYATNNPLNLSELQPRLWSHRPLGSGPMQVGRNDNALLRILDSLHSRYPQTITKQPGARGPRYAYLA